MENNLLYGKTFINNLEDTLLRDDIRNMSLKSQKSIEYWIDTLKNSTFSKKKIDTPLLKLTNKFDRDDFKIELLNPRTHEEQSLIDREKGIFSYTEYLTENQIKEKYGK